VAVASECSMGVGSALMRARALRPWRRRAALVGHTSPARSSVCHAESMPRYPGVPEPDGAPPWYLSCGTTASSIIRSLPPPSIHLTLLTLTPRNQPHILSAMAASSSPSEGFVQKGAEGRVVDDAPPLNEGLLYFGNKLCPYAHRYAPHTTSNSLLDAATHTLSHANHSHRCRAQSLVGHRGAGPRRQARLHPHRARRREAGVVRRQGQPLRHRAGGLRPRPPGARVAHRGRVLQRQVRDARELVAARRSARPSGGPPAGRALGRQVHRQALRAAEQHRPLQGRRARGRCSLVRLSHSNDHATCCESLSTSSSCHSLTHSLGWLWMAERWSRSRPRSSDSAARTASTSWATACRSPTSPSCRSSSVCRTRWRTTAASSYFLTMASTRDSVDCWLLLELARPSRVRVPACLPACSSHARMSLGFVEGVKRTDGDRGCA